MALKPAKEPVLDRFKRYVQIDTQSQEESDTFPSTDKQWDLLRMLRDELEKLGIADATIDEHGYVFGTVPATVPEDVAAKIPTVGFLAHVDTSPAITGTNVKPVVHPNYQGGDIVLPGDPSEIITASDYPNLEKHYIGMDIVTSDGTTLLGADDKAGVAEIMTAVDQLLQNPDVEHGTIRVAFTPDEEVGRGTEHFDVKKFGADFAYTLDGGPIGEVQIETFNAFGAVIHIEGVGVHPGYAKDKMVNAIKILADIIKHLPDELSPETTDGRDGFIYPYVLGGQAEEITLKLLIRDFEMSGIEEKKAIIVKAVEAARKLYPKATIDVEFKEQYLNMRYPIEKEPRITEYAEEAIRRAGIEPEYTLVRGGTDGSRLTYMGLPTPNLFDGGEAIHSKREWVPVQVMEKSVETIIHLATVVAERERGA